MQRKEVTEQSYTGSWSGGRYPDVSVPVTLVYSEQDWSRPAERDHVAGLLADVQRITLPNTGHFSALERPTEMARILLARS